MFLESRLGPKAVEKALDLSARVAGEGSGDGATAESRVRWWRAAVWKFPVCRGCDAVIYGKGTWIFICCAAGWATRIFEIAGRTAPAL